MHIQEKTNCTQIQHEENIPKMFHALISLRFIYNLHENGMVFAMETV